MVPIVAQPSLLPAAFREMPAGETPWWLQAGHYIKNATSFLFAFQSHGTTSTFP
jgi:hypothetical protein